MWETKKNKKQISKLTAWDFFFFFQNEKPAKKL